MRTMIIASLIFGAALTGVSFAQSAGSGSSNASSDAGSSTNVGNAESSTGNSSS